MDRKKTYTHLSGHITQEKLERIRLIIFENTNVKIFGQLIEKYQLQIPNWDFTPK